MADLRAAAQQAIALICSARLCEVNSMSSRQEMLRLLIEATDILRVAMAQPEQEPVAWAGLDLDSMAEAFHRCIEAHAACRPFHQPVNADAMLALRELRGVIPAMKAYTAPPARRPLTPAQEAAPELLEALKGVLRVADRKTDEFDAARAAIAKAEGA